MWLGLTLYVLITRIAHDVGGAILDRVQAIVIAEERASLLPRLPRRLVERAAADPTTPEDVAAVFAQHVLERHTADLIRLARGRRRWRRIRALRILVRARWHAAAPLLAEALESGDEELAAAAVALLGEVGDQPAAEALVEALRDNRFSRSRIAAQLDVSPEPIAQQLLSLLRDPDAQVRFWGATLLGRYAGDPAVDLELTRAAADVNPSVRAASVESLAVSRAPAATTTAVALLRDPVWFVRAHAARALRDLGGNTGAAVAELLADESWWVRAAAKEALEARPERALAVLMDYLDHDDEFARNGAAEVLQNTGVLDTLLAADDDDIVAHGIFGNPAPRILQAGGSRLAASAAARNGLDPDELERFVR